MCRKWFIEMKTINALTDDIYDWFRTLTTSDVIDNRPMLANVCIVDGMAVASDGYRMYIASAGLINKYSWANAHSKVFSKVFFEDGISEYIESVGDLVYKMKPLEKTWGNGDGYTLYPSGDARIQDAVYPDPRAIVRGVLAKNDGTVRTSVLALATLHTLGAGWKISPYVEIGGKAINSFYIWDLLKFRPFAGAEEIDLMGGDSPTSPLGLRVMAEDGGWVMAIIKPLTLGYMFK